MKTKHIPDVMATGHFTHSRICHLLEQNDEEGITYVIQYLCKSLEQYNHYIEHEATVLRDEHLLKFKDNFISFRTVMEILE